MLFVLNFKISSSIVKDESEETVSFQERSENIAESLISGSEKVTCPICGNKVRGEEYMINSHLGIA